MKFHASIAWAAMAAALAVPAAAQAKAHAKPHHRAAASKDADLVAELRIAEQQIAQLTAQVNTLQGKTDAAASQQVATAQVAAQSQIAVEQATAASAKADTALAHADAAQKAAAHPAVPEAVKWAAGTTIGGQVFVNASNIYFATRQSTGAYSRSTNNGTGLDVKRVYLTVDHTFNKVFSADVTLDASNVVGNTSYYANTNAQNSTPATSSGVATTTNSSQSVVGKGLFVKYAYLQAKLNPAFTVRVGSAPTSWIPYIDGITGTRYIDQGLVERDKFGNSADWGVHVLGDLLGGHVSYQVSAVDGAGYRKLYVTKDVDVDGRLSAQYNGLFAAVGGYIGKEGNITEGVRAYHTYTRGDAAVGFKNARFTVEGEYLYARNLNTVTSAPVGGKPVDDRSNALSVFGKVVLNSQFSLLGRYDWVKYEPNRLVPTAARDHFYFGGVQYEPIKNIDLTLLYKRELVNNNSSASLATNDGTFSAISGASTLARTTYDEIGLFGQFKF